MIVEWIDRETERVIKREIEWINDRYMCSEEFQIKYEKIERK